MFKDPFKCNGTWDILITDEPSKPNNVEVVDWDKDHADLKWTKPDNDGGAPITGYVIEYKVIFPNDPSRDRIDKLVTVGLLDFRKNLVKIGSKVRS